MKRDISDYQFGKYRMLEPPIWGNHYGRALENFRKSAEAGDPRGAFMLGKMLLLRNEKEDDAAVGMMWLERAAGMGYQIAECFLRFYRSFGRPITRELLESVTLETEDADLLCLSGQLKFFDSPFTVFLKEEHPKTLEGIELLEKAADKGHLEAVRFLYESYFGYFWQVFPAPEKAKCWLETYLELTNDPLEQEEMDQFDYACTRMSKSRRNLLFYTQGRSCSQDLPENRGSLDDSFYDRFREEI